MKLILTQDVTGLGGPGDIVEVKAGYGRNFLLPRGYAIAWNRGAEKQIGTIKRARSAREIRGLEHAKEVRDELAGLEVKLATKAGETGRLFGSVTGADIAAAVKAAGGPALDKRTIAIETPIKTVGTHRVDVALHPEVIASIDVLVAAE
jgi:large subunit ribosomal protein L9